MFPRLVTRVVPRFFGPNVSGLRVALSARQLLVARTFLTTAQVSEPAAKRGSTKSKSAKSKTTPKKKAAAKKSTATKKKPAKAGRPKKDDSNDPEARFKNGLKAVKVKKSELPPVKPTTAYSLFLREQYKEIGQTGTFGEKSTEIAARWKQLSEAEKQRYFEQAESLKEAFAKTQEEWYKNTDPRILRAINVKRRAENKPLIHMPTHLRNKRPLSSYMRYMLEVRDSVELDPSLSTKEALNKRAAQIGKMWHELPAQEKQRYTDQYHKELEEYKAAKSEQA
ncbi:hypothetical protein L226DRAFT_531339 [Lentinus tigrinus ALCF2SS1-7]|uniref:HMG box domain-containing protein n=1 Tax=Lentinus tigrinus ALCF2SS1-6 TaxID=1328759 RepID=A0A5C2RZT6_9APHY|nr:hypothetical protein L227DRAFT_656118 [Lentinus tigrinus ALCF2SS1-6]RPD79579.1 hypothetical protein L226DRAFT_531339 [Lentinus tigrinus ALCF2SS1-7]